MGVRSDLAVLFSFENNEENIINFKSKMNEIILKYLNNENFNYLLSNFYKTINNDEIEFLFAEECIKSEYIPTLTLFNELDCLLFINYEMIDLPDCYDNEGYEHIQNNNENEMKLYISHSIQGLPEVEDISLLEFIKT